jgi:kynurenine 3-monooxygenase
METHDMLHKSSRSSFITFTCFLVLATNLSAAGSSSIGRVMSKQKIHIIGGGPVGCALALLLAKDGIPSVVYEGRSSITNEVEESYPIGVNRRGLHALETISKDLAAKCCDTGHIVESWAICSGSQRVAEQKSGVVVGTSRGKINIILATEAQKSPLIEVVFGHRLRDIQLTSKKLIFDIFQENGSFSPIEVILGSNDKVVGADGVKSYVRSAIQKQDSTFKSLVTPWKCEFRVLFATPGATIAQLDANIHYIISGCYCAIVQGENGGAPIWTCVIGVRDDHSQDMKDLLLSNDPSESNVQALKTLLRKLAPQIVPIIPDSEYSRYFTRRTFRGAIVECNKYHYEDWLVLIGDAAHSVIPPTGRYMWLKLDLIKNIYVIFYIINLGEGINSGFEDAAILADILRKEPSSAFSEYTKTRISDLEGLAK